jgi:hypothetical protein
LLGKRELKKLNASVNRPLHKRKKRDLLVLLERRLLPSRKNVFAKLKKPQTRLNALE